MQAPARSGSRSGYRPEIDGLRALAIAPVVLHHANPAVLPGGFTGVDIFFVISGYLICAIIADELADHRFSLWRFWERRVRRIVPALATMLVSTSFVAWAILTPEDFAQFAKALVAASVFASNLHFARGTDYFETVEGTRPLVHTWTLGVEEQFYLMFPPLLMLLWRWRPQALQPAIALLALGSFVLALWMAPRWPLGAFYLLPTRMWELLLGAACALLPRTPRAGNVLAATGLGMILAGFWMIGPDTPAPGALFLLPGIGTALVLLFGRQGTMAARILGWRPLVLLGLVSFGTYLWHQPVLSFLAYVHFGPLPIAVTLAAIATSVVLGALSYRLIEQPVRQRRRLVRPPALLVACGTALALPLAGGASGHFGLLLPLSGAEAARLDGLRPPNASAQVIEPPGKRLAFVLYGDSHAAQYFDAAQARFGTGALLSAPGCLSAGGVSNQYPDDPAGADCRALADRLPLLVARRGVRTVIWAQRWERTLYGTGSEAPLGTTLGTGAPFLRQAILRLADSLPQGTRIVLVGNSPTAWAAGPLLEGGWLRCRAWRNVACPESYPASEAEGRKVNVLLQELAAADPRLTYIDAAAPLCPEGRCQLILEGRLNYWDGSHMTTRAAARVMAQIDLPLIMDP